MRRLAALFALTALALSACPPPPPPPSDGGADDAGAVEVDAGPPRRDAGSPDAGLGPIPIEQWCAKKAWFTCMRDERCGKLSAHGLSDCLARNLAGCDAVPLTSGVHAGRLRYLEPEAIACLEATLWGACSGDSPHCAQIFTGLVPPDGGCFLPQECDPSGFCLMDDACPHTCRAYVGSGQLCDGSMKRCDPSRGLCDVGDGGVLVCKPFATLDAGCARYDACGPGAVCLDSTCVRQQAGPGETCGGTNGYPSCPTDYFCRRDLSQTPAPPGTCERRMGQGGACTGNQDCLSSLRCTTVVTTGVCADRAMKGEACASYGDCEDELYCSPATGTCASLPKDGGDCGSTGSSYRCATGYYCDFLFAGTTDTCVARHPPGSDCYFSEMCAQGECRWGQKPDGGVGQRCVLTCAARLDGGV